ncbi:hypothetical protein STEG23_020470 [Scotinomys teguina]
MDTLVSLEPSKVANVISKPVLTTKVLLGHEDPLIHVFAKNLVAFVSRSRKQSRSSGPGCEGQERGGAEGLEGGDLGVPDVVTYCQQYLTVRYR